MEPFAAIFFTPSPLFFKDVYKNRFGNPSIAINSNDNNMSRENWYLFQSKEYVPRGFFVIRMLITFI